ncbi:MAG: TlpA family protein disulfide reductase, partial [Sulfurihydrogenibium azorense]
VKASEYIGKGKPAVVVYWAIGDVDTYKILPKINQLYKKYKDKVIFIAPLLSVSNPKEVQEAKKFIPIDMPVWLAGSDSIKGYSIEKVDVPYLVFIDKNGNIVDIMTTARDIKKIEENIKKLL